MLLAAQVLTSSANNGHGREHYLPSRRLLKAGTWDFFTGGGAHYKICMSCQLTAIVVCLI